MTTLERLMLKPNIHPSCFIAPNALLLGELSIGAESSVWYGAVLRADNDFIRIGDRTNIQENAVLHVDPGAPISIGNDCIIGHLAMVHGAQIGHNVLVGINATVLNHAQIGNNVIIGANALVTSGTIIPDNSLVLGSPAKVVKTLSHEQIQQLRQNAEVYVEKAKTYKQFYAQGR